MTVLVVGFQGIDLWSPFGKCRYLAEAQELGAEGFRKLLARHRLELACYTTYRTKGHDEGFPGFAEFIGACGGGVVVRESKYGKVGKEGLEGAMARFFADLKPEIELARKHKVRLAIYHLQARKVPVEKAMRACGKQLVFVYAWQKGRGVAQLPGHGPTDFKPWLRTLAEQNYAHWMTPFMHGEVPGDEMTAAVAKAREYLEPMRF